MSLLRNSLIGIVALVAAGAAFYQFGQRPVDNLWGPAIGKGNTTEFISEIDLGPIIPELTGYHFRSRYIDVPRNGIVRIHSHFGRPAFSYVASSTVEQYRSDTPKDRRPLVLPTGSLTMDYNMAHWWRNVGPEPARWYVTDIYPATKKGE